MAFGYLCNIGLQCLFFQIACSILNLAGKHGITVIPANMTILLSVEADFLLEWHFLFQMAQGAFQLGDKLGMDLLASSHTNQCQHFYTLENLLPLVALGLNAFSHPWMCQVSYIFFHPTLGALVLPSFLEEHVTGQYRALIVVACGWMEVPWLSWVLIMSEDFLIKVPL